MGYSAIVANIKGKQTAINDAATAIESIEFDSVWSGGAHDKLTSSLKTITNNLKQQEASISDFCTGLVLLQGYKDNKETISALSSSLSALPNTKEVANERSAIQSKINSLETTNQQLKSNIESIMSSVSTVASTGVNIVSVNYGDLNYMYDLAEIYAMYNTSGQLTKLGDGQSLYKLYDQYDDQGNLVVSGKDYVEGIIIQIQQKYDGREAAVNSALAMLKLAADKGVKLDYEHKGTRGQEPYVPTEQVASGVDCNPFASWCVDKGTPGGFQWRPVGSFKSVGTAIPQDEWYRAQPGDVFVSDGHVGIVVENHPDKQEIITAEASGSTAGIITKTKSYATMRQYGNQIRDMTNVYNGTENTNREIFNQYVNWDTYKRKV